MAFEIDLNLQNERSADKSRWQLGVIVRFQSSSFEVRDPENAARGETRAENFETR